MLAQTWSYALAHSHDVSQAAQQHVALSVAAVAIATCLGVPLGRWTSRAAAGPSLINSVTAVRVIPSLALLAFMLPLFGIGFVPALVALTILAFPPILINTDVAFRTLDPAVRNAAAGMGMSSRQLLLRVEYPLATPVMMAGLRTASIEVIASATLAAFIGAGGLGTFILDGLATNDVRQLLVGAVGVALLALAAEAALSVLIASASRARVSSARARI